MCICPKICLGCDLLKIILTDGRGIAEQSWKISGSLSKIGNCVGVVSSMVGISGFFFFFFCNFYL